MQTEVVRIIESALNGQSSKVREYCQLLIQNLKKDGDGKFAERLERTLKMNVRGNQPMVSLDEIANLPQAVVTSEDQKFAEHFGFDVEAIEKAKKYNEKHKGKKMKGASTISQQTAKNVFLWPSRSWIRKGFEVYFTFLIEVLWSKERILEVYLNVIEMGPGIYGAQAASQYYFNKSASQLSKLEAASIAAILPNPVRWSASKPTPYIKKKRTWILRRMNTFHLDSL